MICLFLEPRHVQIINTIKNTENMLLSTIKYNRYICVYVSDWYTVILEMFGVKIFSSVHPTTKLKNTTYNEKLYVCVPEQRKLDASKI